MANNNDERRFEINIEQMQPIYLKNETYIEFRDPDTNQGGSVSFRRIDDKTMLVAFEDLDPGVVPTGITGNPREAKNMVAILDLTITWLEKLKRVSLPGAWEAVRPLTFDGIPTLKEVRRQLKQEANRGPD